MDKSLFFKNSGIACTMGLQGTQGGLARAVLRALACQLVLDPQGIQMRAGPEAIFLNL